MIFFDFKSFSNNQLGSKSVDSDGRKVNWLQIVSLLFQKANPFAIKYKTTFDEEYREINISSS